LSVYASRSELEKGAEALAASIAAQSPVAVGNSKANILFGRDHSLADGLQFAVREM
jgi:enoyl-CoA hydratase